MISVAMATYNGEKYIYKQLESIVRQTYIPDEVVIIDDCSTDNTYNFILNYVRQEKTISWRIQQNSKNEGYIRTFIKAIDSCVGDIIVLSDQDDLWKSTKLDKIVKIFNNTSVLSLHCDIDIIDQNDDIITKNVIGYKKRLEKYTIQKFVHRLNYCGMSSAFRSCLVKDLLSIDISKLFTHDWTIHALAVCKDGFYTSSEVMACRRYHTDNVALTVGKTRRKKIEQRINIVQEYYDYYLLLEKMYNEYGLCNENELIFLGKVVDANYARLEYLSNKNFLKAVVNLKYLKYYPTWKAYVSDWLYLIGVF